MFSKGTTPPLKIQFSGSDEAAPLCIKTSEMYDTSFQQSKTADNESAISMGSQGIFNPISFLRDTLAGHGSIIILLLNEYI